VATAHNATTTKPAATFVANGGKSLCLYYHQKSLKQIYQKNNINFSGGKIDLAKKKSEKK
jgi:hypothetical protein